MKENKWDHVVHHLPNIQSLTHLRKELQLILRKSSGTIRIIKRILNKSECKKLTWETYVGTGEASTSGVVASSLWAVKGMVIGGVSNQCLLTCRPLINVTPTFQERYVSTYFNCIVSFKIGQTMFIFIKELRKMRAF